MNRVSWHSNRNVEFSEDIQWKVIFGIDLANDQIWSNLIKSGQVWPDLIRCDQKRAEIKSDYLFLIRSSQIWSNLIICQINAKIDQSGYMTLGIKIVS